MKLKYTKAETINKSKYTWNELTEGIYLTEDQEDLYFIVLEGNISNTVIIVFNNEYELAKAEEWNYYKFVKYTGLLTLTFESK